MIDLINENLSRKIDSLGRVSIPSGLRSRFGYQAGDEVEFKTFNAAGQDYVALCKPNGIDPKYEITWETLKELGCEIPEALNNVVYGGTQIKGQMQLDL